MRRSVVITGGGVVGSFGCGLDRLADALRSSTVHLSEVDRTAGYHRSEGAHLAALVGVQDLSPWLPAGAARRMSPTSKLAVAAARMALRSAGLADEAAGTPATAVVLATSFGAPSFTERLYRTILTEGPEMASPFLFTECVVNAPAAQVAISCRATGPNVTVVQREAGALIALGRGAAEIVEGRLSRALVGAADEMPPLVHALLDRYGGLACATAEGLETARPLDRRRNGFLASEGASVFVLEDEEAARARGARLLARVRAWGGAFDPSASRAGWGKGEGPLKAALLRLLARAGLSPGDVSRVVSGASGSVEGDRLEGRVLQAAWDGAPLPVVLAPKGVTGEYGGGFVASVVLAAQNSEFGPTAGFAEPDPDLGVIPHRGGTLPPPTTILASSLAAGGAAAWVVLEKA